MRISSLTSYFSLEDLDPLHYFLGIQVSKSFLGLHLSQPQYIPDLLRTEMDGAKPCATPCVPGDSLSKFTGTSMDDPQLYRRTVGALQYATITRSDISFCCQ